MGNAFARRFTLSCGLVALVLVIPIAGLVVADWREAPRGASGVIPMLASAIERGDRLHYVGHFVLGRLADVCPCTEAIADDQYDRADAHARTVRQRALVKNERPQTLQAALSDFDEIITSSLRWGQQGATWLLVGSPEAPIRLMALGDSLTRGVGSDPIPDQQGGYRPRLWQLLTGAGYPVMFVGSQLSGPAPLAEQRHEGHVGQRIDQIAAHAGDWIVQRQPDVVLLMIGTNDLDQGVDLARALSRLDRLLDRITAASAHAEILVATLPPSADRTLASRIAAYNTALPEVIDPRRRNGGRVRLVDVGSVVTLEDLADPVHPSVAGYAKIAEAWFVALDDLLPSPSGRSRKHDDTSRAFSSLATR